MCDRATAQRPWDWLHVPPSLAVSLSRTLYSRTCLALVPRDMTGVRPRPWLQSTLAALKRSCLVPAGFAVIALAAAAAAAAGPAARPPVLFDDFSYASATQLAPHGWVVRTKPGWPGVPGAAWRQSNVSVAGGLLRMTSSTDGTYAGTTQTQICQQRKFREGTYATHVRFRDAPSAGPGGDQPVESFYTISPLKRPLDSDYSEIDFEYLPHGGWGL